MALGMYFTPSSFTPARYDDTLKRLEEAGAGSPPGRLYHVAMEADGLIQVFDVWESEASFQAFGKTLLPIMARIATITVMGCRSANTIGFMANTSTCSSTRSIAPGNKSRLWHLGSCAGASYRTLTLTSQ